MRYYIDTEFKEQPGSIEIISLGIVAEDDRTLYLENSAFPAQEFINDDWLTENVLPELKWYKIRCTDTKTFYDKDLRGNVTGCYTTDIFKSLILGFVAGDSHPKFYADYGSYDWVVFCWLFGRMIDLPDNFPMYIRDIQQMLDERRLVIPDEMQPVGQHNALIDAQYCKDVHKWIMSDDG